MTLRRIRLAGDRPDAAEPTAHAQAAIELGDWKSSAARES